jgi:nitronate monooxygenase
MAEEAQRDREACERADFDIAAVIAGEAAGLIDDLPSVGEIVERVVREAEAVLHGGARR